MVWASVHIIDILAKTYNNNTHEYFTVESRFIDELGTNVVILPNNSYKTITNNAWVRARLCKLQKGKLDSQPQVITFTSCLSMVGGSLRVLLLLPPLKLVAMI